MRRTNVWKEPSMRYVENTLCALSVALLAAGCASSPRSAQDQAAAAAPPPRPRPRAGAVAPPVDAAAQRSFDEARRALAAGQTAEAERRFLALTQSNPELGGPHASLGLIYQQAGKTGRGRAAVRGRRQGQPAAAGLPEPAGRRLSAAGPVRQGARGLRKGHRAGAGPCHRRCSTWASSTTCTWAIRSRALELYERYLLLTPAGDATVSKWVVDLKNRKPQTLAAKGKS